MARGCCKGGKLQRGVSRENPSSLPTGTGKSCLENWTRRQSWENLSAGASGREGGREGGQSNLQGVEGFSVSNPLEFGFLYYGMINVPAFKGNLLALMLRLQRAV